MREGKKKISKKSFNCAVEWKKVALKQVEGISIGLSQGAHQKAVETAKTLLAFGDSIEKVSKVTGLSPEEIENL